jgi:GTPase
MNSRAKKQGFVPGEGHKTPQNANQSMLDAFFNQPAGSDDAAAQPEQPAQPVEALPQKCGLIAIVGKPNVGKSTLLNALVGQKVSITSRKAQTTRHRILGIRTQGAAQLVFADTPGFQTQHGKALNRSLNKAVTGAVSGVDVIVWVVEAGRLSGADEKVRELLANQAKGVPVIVVANKLDTVKQRAEMAPWLQALSKRGLGSGDQSVHQGVHQNLPFAEIVPMSAKQRKDIERLLSICEKYLPEQPWIYTEDHITDKSERFLAGEVVREKLFRFTGDELPYTSTVVVDQFTEEPGKTAGRFIKIAATLVVERDSHKAMIIGSGGEGLKRMGTEARQELEKLFDAKVFLQLWVKVQSGWADNEARVKSFGYE